MGSMPVPSSSLPSGQVSPFDAIRHEGTTGEWWSARELMPLLGYRVWRDFANAVERAKVACQNSGSDPGKNFADARKVSGVRGPESADYRLTRYGAYLVAMNGDPRKPEIAAAQTYFAIQTRKAETAGRSVVDTKALSRRTLAMMVIEAEDAREAAEATALALTAKAIEDAPKIEAHDQYLSASGGERLVRQVAKLLGWQERNLRALMLDEKLIYRRPAPCGDTQYDPYAAHVEHFRVVEQPVEHTSGPCTHYTLYVRPSGVELIRRRIERRGAGLASLQREGGQASD